MRGTMKNGELISRLNQDDDGLSDDEDFDGALGKQCGIGKCPI